ncbi:hypothetical protein BGM26_07410 [Bacillus sp. FJAT-29790]|uniref:hypothetical protein n=1 Tax=Bacillus sp. FJAT-29790 TaxID=1895002 RepID=UPI001C21077C|nr:hypothetical protein [Bacillus sp. FJAT-29790]MBU8878817.1 hypothetical protein [Bacillus sp. FJAT-29790]
MLIEKTLSVYYLIDDMLTVIPTKVFYEQSEDDELKNIHYEIYLERQRFISKASDVTELAIKNLQKVLPKNIRIASCQSCRYGNFCPYGDNDNEVFCLKDIEIKDKNDVCEIFSSNTALEKRRRNLLDFCPNYKPISLEKYYTYNDWN